MKAEIKKVKEFMEKLHFHGYIDHDITKLDDLINDYYTHTQQPVNSQGVSEEIKVVVDRILNATKYETNPTVKWIEIQLRAVLPTPPTEKPTEQKTEGE